MVEGKNKVPIREGLFHFSPSGIEPPHLIGSRCQTCGQIFVPARIQCSKCSAEELGQRACWAALEDARVEWKDISVAFCGHAFQGNTMGQRVMNRIGMTGIPIVNVENACASGSTAFITAYQSVASGMYDTALALGVEKMSFKGMIDSTRAVARKMG